MRGILLFVAALEVSFGWSACATAPAPAAETGGDTVCVEKVVTGSRIPEEVCETPGQAGQRQAEDQAAVQRLQRNTPAPTGR